MGKRAWVVFAITVIWTGTCALAVTGGQVDNFQDNTAQGWQNGQNTPGTVIPGGGPAGANDNYLAISAFPSRLAILNRTQWAGDFTSIDAVSMDLRNNTGEDLPVRIALKQDIFNISGPAYVSDAFDLPSDNVWHSVTFNLDAGSLIAVNDPAALATFLADVHEMRILVAGTPTFIGDFIAGTLDADNITAVVPEPSALGLLAAAGALLLRRRRA